MDSKSDQSLTTKQPESSGLQSVEPHDAPEVASAERSSVHSPQAVPPSDDQEKQTFEYFGSPGASGPQDERAHYGEPPVYEEHSGKEVVREPEKQRICGMRRKVFLWILALVLLVTIVAAVLGGVLGSVLTSSGSSSGSKTPTSSQPSSSGSTSGGSTSGPSPSPSRHPLALPAVRSDTGQAVIEVDGSSYQYVQDSKGWLVENKYSGGSWSVSDNAVVATDARLGSPIAATFWVNNGGTYRQVFYVDDKGAVMTTNTTQGSTWTTPYNILINDYAAKDSIALAVVSDTKSYGQGLGGVRVYYASANQESYIQEVGFDWISSPTTPIWNMWATFPGADITSGVATVLSDNVNHLYIRNASGLLQQWQWNYVNPPKYWQKGVHASLNMTSGSDLAAVNDASYADYLFYADSDSQLVRLTYDGKSIGSVEELVSIATGSKCSAFYDSGQDATSVYYQNSGNSNTTAYEKIGSSGTVINSGTVQ